MHIGLVKKAKKLLIFCLLDWFVFTIVDLREQVNCFLILINVRICSDLALKSFLKDATSDYEMVWGQLVGKR